jgi:hypothetical protein
MGYLMYLKKKIVYTVDQDIERIRTEGQSLLYTTHL